MIQGFLGNIGALSKLQGLGTVSNFRVRSGGQEPGQGMGQRSVLGATFQGLLQNVPGLGVVSGCDSGGGPTQLGSRVLGLVFAPVFVEGPRLLEASLAHEEICQSLGGGFVAGVNLDGFS